MEEIVYMCVIFLFIILIYNHFFKIKEGLENCNLTGFRKKSPEEIRQMSTADRAKYNCQLKVFNQKIYSDEEMQKTMEETSNNIEKYKSVKNNSIQTYLNRIKEMLPKYVDEKKKRKVAVTKLTGYVCPTKFSFAKQYCDQQKGGDDEDEVEVDVEKEGGKRAVRDERKGPDPKLHKSQGKIVDKQEKEAEKKKD